MAGLSGAGAIWLDVSRLASRAGRGVLTGIDRVELAYLDHLLAECGTQARFVMRTTRGYLLLDQRGGALLSDLVTGRAALGVADLVSRLLGKGSDPRHRLEAALRPHAIDRCLATGLARMVARRGDGGFGISTPGTPIWTRAALGPFRVRAACGSAF